MRQQGQHSKQPATYPSDKSNLQQRDLFLRGQYPNPSNTFEKLHHAFWKSAVSICTCPTLPNLSSKKTMPLLEIGMFPMCGIIHTQHHFQKCNTLGNVSIIEEGLLLLTTKCCFCMTTRSSCENRRLEKLDYFCFACVLFPFGQISPAFI